MTKLDFAYHPELDQNPNNIAKVQQNQNPDAAILNQLANTFPNFDLTAAYNSGYSAHEIADYLGKQTQASSNNSLNSSNNFDFSSLSKKHPNFDFQSAVDAGYSPEEIQGFLNKNKPKKSLAEKSARIAEQYALGLAENALLPYEIAVAPLASKEAQNMQYRETLSDDLERLMDQKAMGQWDEQDQALYDSIVEQILDPRKSMQNVQTADIGIRGLAEKVTGQDLHPEGILEKAANWSGFIKDPKKIAEIAKLGFKPKEIVKNALPGFTDISRGLSAGTALEMAEEGQFGPLGHLSAALVGDIVGHSPKGIYNVAKNPKKSAAQFLNFATRSNSKNKIATELLSDFNKSGMKMDAGTLTQSPLVQMIQARLTASGLTGEALDNLRKELSNQVFREYETILKDIGELSFENSYQASEAIKDALKVEEQSLNIDRDLSRRGRSLQGRVDMADRPAYQQELFQRISPNETEFHYQTGENLKTAAENIKEPLKNEFRQRWSNFGEQISQIPSGPQAELVEQLRNFVDSHAGSLLLGESAAEAKVLRSAENLLNQLSTETGELIGVSLEDLRKTKTTLGDIANWEVGHSDFQSSFKKLTSDVDAAIRRTLERESPQLLNEFEILNSEYSSFKDLFENKNLKSLFEPKNQNYNSIYNEFTSNPDKLRAVEDIFYNNPRGVELTNELKREYAQRTLDKPNLTDKDIRNLGHVLGPEFEEDMMNFVRARERDLANPNPAPRAQNSLNIRPSTENPSGQTLQPGRVKETGVKRAEDNLRKKTYEHLSKKSPEQIMKQMDTIKGIQKLKRVLNLTPEGKDLFKKLKRFKLAEIIDNKMIDSLNGNIKLGTFTNLLNNKKTREIVKELVGKEAYDKIRLLQKNSKSLMQSANKFMNASQSATSLIDMGLIGAATTGVLSGNFALAVPAIAKIGGSYVLANLLADPVFLKELEKAVLTKNPKKFQKYLLSMKPIVEKSLIESKNSDLHDKDI